jgi:phenylacetate-CoA ligase
MFETGVRQARMALAMVWGRPINTRNLERLIGDALQTLAIFGTPGDDVGQLLDGPLADAAVRRQFQDRAIQRTARRLAKVSPYYAEVFSAAGVRPERLSADSMSQVPLTSKAQLIAGAAQFIASDTVPYVSTRTTGTSGRPAEIWLSRYESELWPAMAALSGLLRNEIGPRDCMQINISSRATAAVQHNLAVCRLVGARTRVLGVVPPEESVDSLVSGDDDRPSLLATYPSYLAELVRAARRRGLGPSAFRLRRIDCGGEVLSAALVRAAEQTFGYGLVNDSFGMTEVLPVSGRVCEQDHLHHDINMGFIEVIDLDGDEPARPGQLGRVVITPYYPYRECMPVFRYDTGDVVRRLVDDTLNCTLAAIPATSRIVGKADQLLVTSSGTITPRDIVEAYEALPCEAWPARYDAAVVDGSIRLTVADPAVSGRFRGDLERQLATMGARVAVVEAPGDDVRGHILRPLRADLRETTFTAGRS